MIKQNNVHTTNVIPQRPVLYKTSPVRLNPKFIGKDNLNGMHRIWENKDFDLSRNGRCLKHVYVQEPPERDDFNRFTKQTF